MKEIVITKKVTDNRTDTLKVLVNNNKVTLSILSYDDSITLGIDELGILLDRVERTNETT